MADKIIAKGRFWAPNLSNELHLPGASILIGGPHGQELAEHAHDFIQISAGYRSIAEDGASTRKQKAPDYFSKPGFARAIPVGLPHRGGWSNGTEVVVVHLRESLIESVADELRVSGRPNLQFDKISTDLFVLELLKVAGREMRVTGVFNRAYFESLVVVLVGHLIRTYGRYRSILTPAGCRLNPRQMQLIDEFIDKHLEQNVGAQAIANVLGIGLPRLLAAMRLTTGRSPHQYLMLKRIQRAKQLLRNPTLGLAQIAVETGFSSQSHFGAVFKRLTAFTPRRYRMDPGAGNR